MKLIYTGMLSEHHIRLLEEHIKDGFTFALLMKSIPDALSLTGYRVVFLHGGPDESKALLLTDKESQLALVKRQFPDLVMDDSPVMTLLDTEPDPRVRIYRKSSFFWMVACLISMVATTAVFLASAS